MAVDWFLIDAPHVAPREYEAWRAAKAQHEALFYCVLDAEDGTDAQRALELAALEAKSEADRLEQVARDAWRRTWRAPGA
ncbi:hypothetical protein [Burkholderia sp. TSV86]|uniref:hypothetical protein n=1 Tax=Burkholderia sp. TSV86 TaxID=1385594 RepID=UPI0007526D99|nr:hypothetical protein [Burkholderia sp. TSV86]KVE37233.1 hypothetical protein WS68_03195 [Burkholderia sp. TSV86]